MSGSPVTTRAAQAWAFRWTVEQIAERAFAAMATELTELRYPRELIDACTRVSEDEARHVGLCATLTRELGGDAPARIFPACDHEARQLAPAGLSREDALVYEIVARCCIAETESTATLIELLPVTVSPVHDVVRQIASDEVRHARLGWQFLAHLKGRRDLTFLGPHLPAMLETGGAPLFDPSSPAGDEDLARGAFSVSTQRRIFVEVLDEVVFPGLELHGVATDKAREWLAAQHGRIRP